MRNVLRLERGAKPKLLAVEKLALGRRAKAALADPSHGATVLKMEWFVANGMVEVAPRSAGRLATRPCLLARNVTRQTSLPAIGLLLGADFRL